MILLTSFFTWFKSLMTDPNKRSFVLLAVAALAIMMWWRTCNSEKNAAAAAVVKLEISEQNLRAKTDSLHTIIVKGPGKVPEKEDFTSSYISKISDLEKLNKNLYDEAQAESKKNADLKAIIAGGITANNPLEISEQLISYGDSAYGLAFDKSSKSDSLDYALVGVSKFSIKKNKILPGLTELSENEIKIKMVLGFREDDKTGNYVVFMRSPSKLIKIDSLSGSLIIPKKGGDIIPQVPVKPKKFGIGIFVGAGVGANFVPGPVIGIGLSYNIFNF